MSEDIRETARKRVKAKRDFWNMLIIFVVITVLLNVLWFIMDQRDYYWPMWPMLGFAIATVFSAIGTFGPGQRPVSEDAVDREVRKLSGS